MILAYDASTVAMGFAHGGPVDPAPRGGVWKLAGCDEHLFDHTLGSVGRSLVQQVQFLRPRAVYLEAPMSKVDRNHSEASAAALAQMTGGIRMQLGMLHIRVVMCSVFNVRKAFGVNPYLPRKEAKEAVQSLCDNLGWSYANDDESDAKAVWAYGMAREYPGWKPNQPQLFSVGGTR
ncbi:hypothetical protein [uncultured Devosia sp.]|uniref:hypothetical protein n=1 Tax=uncultured Devosia sp. TaxID=211434 RepID=UPI002614A59D|nr:hypothetical protein [uncultured Devosia sp.]